MGIAILNILAFFFLYNFFIKIYLSEKIHERQDITIEYVNSIIERQTLEDIDTIFSDVELEFFELLESNDGKIPLQQEENVNIVIDFLIKSWVSPKYIEEIIPEDNLKKALQLLQDPQSAESHFVKNIFFSLVAINLIFLFAFTCVVLYLVKKSIFPIKKATREIKKLKVGKKIPQLEYDKKDEIWLLIDSINGLNKKLSMQENIRNRLLADISHELKTPITSIQCYLEWISDGVIELSEKNLTSITWEMSRLIQLVNKIMEFEQFENQELIVKKTSQNPYDIISSIVETQLPRVKENMQDIKMIGSKNIEIRMDKDLFTQLVYNLIGNFTKYAGKHTLLEIHISQEKISFSDNGVGIGKYEVPMIFEKFYQGKKEKTGSIENRGIWVGLSIVKKILDAHWWGVKIISDTGKGFRFDILFT